MIFHKAKTLKVFEEQSEQGKARSKQERKIMREGWEKGGKRSGIRQQPASCPPGASAVCGQLDQCLFCVQTACRRLL